MAKPWDIPLLPKNGDAIQDKTYAHVGFVMTRWESLEFELSRLHSLLFRGERISGIPVSIRLTASMV